MQEWWVEGPCFDQLGNNNNEKTKKRTEAFDAQFMEIIICDNTSLMKKGGGGKYAAA